MATKRKSAMAARERGGASVPCPKCHAVPTRVLQTRRDNQLMVWRERKCLHCNARFNTDETPNFRAAAPWTTADERVKLRA